MRALRRWLPPSCCNSRATVGFDRCCSLMCCGERFSVSSFVDLRSEKRCRFTIVTNSVSLGLIFLSQLILLLLRFRRTWWGWSCVGLFFKAFEIQFDSISCVSQEIFMILVRERQISRTKLEYRRRNWGKQFVESQIFLLLWRQGIPVPIRLPWGCNWSLLFFVIVGKNVFPQVRFVRGKTNLPRVHVRRIRPLREENPIVDLFLSISFQWEIREDLCFVSPFNLSRGDLSRICSLWSFSIRGVSSSFVSLRYEV